MTIGKNIKKIVIYIFIVAVVLMVFIALLAVWDVVSEDALWRSFTTVLIMGGATAVISIAADQLTNTDRPQIPINNSSSVPNNIIQ